MKIENIAFGVTDWATIPQIEHKGTTGLALWRTAQFGGIRVRMVEYTPGYKADHWCSKGHILFCLEGELHTELADGRVFAWGAAALGSGSFSSATTGASFSTLPASASKPRSILR